MVLFHEKMQGLQQSNHCQMLHSPSVESTLHTFVQAGEEQGEIQTCKKGGRREVMAVDRGKP